MKSFKNFKIEKPSWSNSYTLTYTGKDKHVVIPEEIIDGSQEFSNIQLKAENPEIIESISLPKNISKLYLNLYPYNAKNVNLSKFSVDPENPDYKDIDGVLYSKDGKTLIYFPPAITGTYTVPEGVLKLESFSFDNSHLDQAILPDSLEEIAKRAFDNSHLKKLIVPKSIKEIDDDAFYNCRDFEEFSFEGDIKINYSYVDTDDMMLNRISHELLPTPECYTLACLKVYPNLKKMRGKFIAAAKTGKKEKILEYLLSLKSDQPAKKGEFKITDTEDNKAIIQKYIGEETEIVIPSEINGKKIIAIDKNTFKENPYLEKVTVSEGIEEIGTGAFEKCYLLEEVRLPESTVKIGSSAFSECSLLKTVNLPKNLTEISKKVFNQCVSLENINIPEKLTKIEEQAFYYCQNLDNINLPDTIKFLGNGCFYNCKFNYGPQLEGQWGYSKRKFYLPPSITNIDDKEDIFAAYPKAYELFGVFEYKVILQVKKGSVPHKYAVKHKINFEFID